MNYDITGWRKPGRSNGGGNCVEIGADRAAGVVGVRDTKDRDGGTLVFDSETFARFVRSL